MRKYKRDVNSKKEVWRLYQKRPGGCFSSCGRLDALLRCEFNMECQNLHCREKHMGNRLNHRED